MSKVEGVQPIFGNWATGNLDPKHMQYYMSALEHYDLIGFHAYSWPRLKNGARYLTLRYRELMEPVNAVFKNKHEVILTEFGLTQGVCWKNVDHHPSGKGEDIGWNAQRLTVDRRYLQGAPFPLTQEHYLNILKWARDELVKDCKYVLLYCVGADSGLWVSFDSVDLVDHMANW